MDTNAIVELKAKFQEIIDLIAQKKVAEAEAKHSEVTDHVNDLIDFATSDAQHQELSPYQVLLNHLQHKIDILKTSLN